MEGWPALHRSGAASTGTERGREVQGMWLSLVGQTRRAPGGGEGWSLLSLAIGRAKGRQHVVMFSQCCPGSMVEAVSALLAKGRASQRAE